MEKENRMNEWSRMLLLTLLMLVGMFNAAWAQTNWYTPAENIDYSGATGYWIRNVVGDRMNLSTRQPDPDNKGQAGWRSTKGRIYKADFTALDQIFYFEKDGSGKIFMYTKDGGGNRTYLCASTNNYDMGIETKTDATLPDGSHGYVKSITNVTNNEHHVRIVMSKDASGNVTNQGLLVANRGLDDGCFVYLDGKNDYGTLCQWIIIPYSPKAYLESEISTVTTLLTGATTGSGYTHIKDNSYKTPLQTALTAAETAKDGTTSDIQTAWNNLLSEKETFLQTAYNDVATGTRYYLRNVHGEYLHRNSSNNNATAIATNSSENERITLTKVGDDYYVSIDGRYLTMNKNLFADDGNKQLALVTPTFVTTVNPGNGKLRLHHIDNNHIGLYFLSNGVGNPVQNGINMSNRAFIHYHDGTNTAPFNLRADRMNGVENVEQFEPTIAWTLEEVPASDQYYTYHLINRSGVEVVNYRVDPTSTGTLAITTQLQSPGANNFRYFSTLAAATANTNGVAEQITTYAEADAKNNGRNIYVGYDVVAISGIHFDNTATYTFCWGPDTSGDTYLQFSSAASNERPISAYTGYDNQLWTLDGGTHQDPYDIELHNVAYPGYHLSAASNNGDPVNASNGGHTGTQNKLYNTATEVQKFVYLQNQYGRPSLVCFAHHIDTDKYYALYWGGSQWFNIEGSNNAIGLTLESDFNFIKNLTPITFTPQEALIHVTYKILSIEYGADGGGRVVYSNMQQDAAGQPLSLDAFLRSPLAKNYKYYTEDQFTITGDRYVLKEGAVESTVYPSTDNTIVYVKYEYDADNLVTFGSNNIHVDLTGRSRYTINTSTEVSKRYIGFTSSRQTFETSNDSYNVHRDNTSDPAVAWNDYYLWTLGSVTGGVPDPYVITIRSAMPVASTFFLAPQSNSTGSGQSTWNGNGSTSWLIPDAAAASCVRTWALLDGNKLVSNIVPGTTTKVVRYSNTAWTYQDELTNISSEADILLNNATVGYHVVNKAGNIAVSTRIPRLTTGALSIPADLKSAHIIDDGQHYRYFTTQADAAAYSLNPTDETAIEHNFISTYDQLAALPSTEVYVGYHYEPENIPAGLPTLASTVPTATRYHVQINNKYWKASDVTWHNRPNFGDGGNELVSANYQWIFFSDNNDPYDIRIKTPYWPDGYLHDLLDNLESGGTNGAYSTSHGMYLNRVTGTNSHGHDEVHSFFFTNSDIGLVIGVATAPNKAGRQSYLYNHNNSYALLQRNTRGGDARQKVVLTKLYLYRVVNKAGNIAVSAYMPATSPLTAPTGLRSPLLTTDQYRFFTTQDGAAYFTNPEHGSEATPITTAPATGEIFIGYNYVNNPEVMDLTGERWYNIKGVSSPNSAVPIYYYRQDENPSWVGIRTRAAVENTLYFMWSFSGLDPYDIHINNGKDNKKLRHGTDNRWDNTLTVNDDTYATFMLLEHEDGYATLAVHNQSYVNSSFNLGTAGDDAYIGTKFYLAYWGSHDGTVKVMCNDAYYYYYSDRNRNGAYASKLVFEPVKYTTTFHIIDNAGREAIKYTSEFPAKMPIDFAHLPATIRSPFLVDETITGYNTAATNGTSSDGRTIWALSDVITSTPETSGTDIYIRYTTDHLLEKPFRLTGTRAFNVRINGNHYIYTSGENILHTESDAGKTTDPYYWHLAGGDPYAIKLWNNAQGNTKFLKYNPSDQSLKVNGDEGAAYTYFIAMRNRTTSSYEVMPATGEDAATNYYNIGRDGDNIKLFSKSEYPQSDDHIQIVLSLNELKARYHIVDKAKKIVIYAQDENVELEVPASISSPLVSKYHFWQLSDFTVDNGSSGTTPDDDIDALYTTRDDTYELTGLTELTSITSAPQDGSGVYQIYVTYDVSDRVQFNGRDKGADGKMYMLKFFNGESFYQEDGSDGVTNLTTGTGAMTKAVYPYSNGDANLYIYGEEQWTTQLGNAATTRTRWPWYIVSANDDPYHVKIQSRQSQNSNYNYLRTYKPQDYGQIVTGVITESNTSANNYVGKKQSGESDGEFDARVARQVPTEYMVLGTAGHFKLTTMLPISDGLTTARRTVNSFEQYWKTYDTIKKKVLSVSTADNSSDPKTVPLDPASYRTTLTTAPYGWHSYKAWANAKQWNGYNDVSGKKEKGYEYMEHWFQTIQMGEEFDFVEIEIAPALVLLDNHGWEIMRKPLPSSPTDPDKAAKYAVIKPYDSPMVKNYYFWKKGSKIPYYHRFLVDDLCVVGDDPFTSTTLTSLPPYEMARDADGRMVDWYVTYEVKEEYASTYTSPQTVDGEAQASAFLIHQGSQYAMMNEGGTTVVGTTVPDDAIAANDGSMITNAMKWYMMPNFNIDAEMGYIYAGEPGASPEAETKADLLAQYLDPTNDRAHHQNGFDPYNLQLKNVAYGKYFKVNGNGAALDGKGGMNGTYSSTPGQLSLNADNTSVAYTAEGYDHSTIRATNTTFMAVDDGNGNIRLMPRFDHTNVITNFTTVETQMSAAPTNDHNGPQTTTFMLPTTYEYIIVDNSGQESLRYKGTFGEVRPSIPTYMASPLAKDFKFYKNLAYDNDTHICTDVAAGTDISAKEITSSFGEAGLTSTTATNMVYVRYSYNEAGDVYNLLSKGDWHSVAVNNTTPADNMWIKVDWNANPAAMVTGTLPDISNYEERKYWECKFIRNALTEDPDPYNVSGFNRARPNDRWAYHFALLSHGDSLALAVAGYSATGIKDDPYHYVFLSSSGSTIAFLEETYFNGSQTTTETRDILDEHNNVIGTETVTVKIPAGTFDGTRSQVAFGDAAEAVVQYYVITNDGHLALKAKEPAARAKGEPTRPTAILPSWARSPLLNKEDFVYYTNAAYDSGTETYTIDPVDRTETLLGLPGEIVYVRYNYNLETTPFTVKDTYFTSDVAPRYLPLDITGNTWYNIVTYSWGDDWLFARNEDNIIRGLDRPAQYQQFSTYPKQDGNFLFQSTKPYIWRLLGSDPYAIKIVNGLKGNDVWFSAASASNDESQLPILSNDPDNEIQTFMLLKPVGSDIRLVATGHLNYFLSNTRWGSNWVSYYDAVDESKENPYQGVGCHSYEFFKAPVVRNYTFHAMNCDDASPVNTWTMMLRRDWLTPVKLQEDIARICAQYEQTGTHTFVDLDAAGRGRFYNAATMNDEDRIYDAGSNEYDVYPEIAEDETYHIWFKYKTKTDELAQYTSTPEQIAADVEYHKTHGRLDMDTHPGDAKWWFMVLDTDADITATGDPGSRTFVGKQMFLRRKDNGGIDWMNNAYALHKNTADNYNNYSCHRLAEWYKAGDNDSFREGRWLWTFVGTDPYFIKVLNLESAVGVSAEGEGIYTLTGADNCYVTTQEVTQGNGTKTYPVVIPEEEPTENFYWGMSPGYGNEHTFSLMAPITNDRHQALFWTMASGEQTDSIAGLGRASDRGNAIQVIRYQPVKYEDVNLVIRRSDEVAAYQAATAKNKPGILAGMKTGISKLYFAASERMFEAGDKIDMSNVETLPLNVRRAFCNYTLYKDIFTTIGGNYIVTAGPYPTTIQASSKGTWSGTGTELDPYVYTQTGDLLYDEDGHPVWTYRNADGTPAESGAQSIYASYEVTTDMFLKNAPTKAQVEAMANNNDHVYFMDFPDASADTHHAYFDPTTTFFEETGDLKKKIDKITGAAKTEKKKWNGSAFVDDRDLWYNHFQYRTNTNRMVSVPENLKWYFVGDPYKLQVYCTAGDWNTSSVTDTNDKTWAAGTKAANLCRFNPVETNFQFVVDCVHLRVPDYSYLDEREYLIPTNEYGVQLPEDQFHNRNEGKPYFNDFYWECVPTTSDDPDAFALRFKEDNDLLGYRNVYYYLSHDGLSKRYLTEGKHVSYHINLSYSPDNERHNSGTYKGYHSANNNNTVIKLVQPVKVYISAFKENNNNAPASQWTPNPNTGGYASSSRWTRMTTDELSEYYGLGEWITDVPRHLKRKYVRYGTMNYQLIEARAYNAPLADCSAHTSNVFVTGTKINPVFKFNVSYKLDDITNSKAPSAEQVHMFTTPTDYAAGNLQWLDVTVGNNWLYYDKVAANTTLVSDYRTALGDNNADGWEDGLKGLHWAFVGDPYDFTIVNRRRYEDTSTTGTAWLATTKATIADHKGTLPNDSVIWTTSLIDKATVDANTTNTSTATAALSDGGINAHYSLQMWKTGGDSDYFMRSASLKEGENDYNNGSTAPDINQTNNYWRMVAKAYPNAASATSYFEAVPYQLSDKSAYNGDIWSSNYSATMTGLGVLQQKTEIRTAVAKDEDKADNDCFDTTVKIVSNDGVTRIETPDMEIRYGDAVESLPYSLRRYGCEYTCYIDYDTTPIHITDFDSKDIIKDGKTFRQLVKSGDISTITYVYTVKEDVSQFFTTEDAAETDDYTWMNTYYKWMQSYEGTNVEVERTKEVFDHYVYNTAGQIIDEVWHEETYVEVVKNPQESYETKGYLNTHTGQIPVFADESAQSEDDRQKWSLVGDPYCFTMKNYAQYLKNPNATVMVDGSGNVQTSNIESANFTIIIDTSGKTYLGIVKPDGNIEKCITFEYSNTSDKSLYNVGSGINTNDPTRNSYDIGGAKPFYLANLIRYADILVYHLVMAHQHTLDLADRSELSTEQKDGYNSNGGAVGVDSRLLEFLKYRGLYEQHDKSHYIESFDASGKPTAYRTSSESAIKNLLKLKGTLRNFISYPVPDQEVTRIGIGNRPQVPWYMKRQFCNYYMYQRDVLRSVVDSEHPAFQEADQEWIDAGKPTTTIISGNTYPYLGGSFTADTYYAGKTFKADGSGNPLPNTFEENGIEKQAYNIKWISVFDQNYWSAWTTADDEAVAAGDTELSTRHIGDKKAPSGYAQASDLQNKILEKLEDCHNNRKVLIDVIYEVNPEDFRFADRSRNTTAWFQLMTNNYASNGLLNFSYKDGVGAQLDYTHHYTNNYLWAPVGDPYGFVLHNRYATINGTGWNDVTLTTLGKLPKGKSGSDWIYIDGSGTSSAYDEASALMPVANVKATYTGSANPSSLTQFNENRIIQYRTGQGGATTDGAANAVYEMFVGKDSKSFLMHPTAAWMDDEDGSHNSYYLLHNTSTTSSGTIQGMEYAAQRAYLVKGSSKSLLSNTNANWRLEATAEQLFPYFDRAGFVGGLDPEKAQIYTNADLYNKLKAYVDDPTLTRDYTVMKAAQEVVYAGTFRDNAGTVVAASDPRPAAAQLPMTFTSTNLVNMTPGYYRIVAFSEDALNTAETATGIQGPRYVSGYRFLSEQTHSKPLRLFETNMDNATIHTFADLNTKKGFTDGASNMVLQGNIELLPADFDPSSIFQFTRSGNSYYSRYTFTTQGLNVQGTAGSSATMSSAAGTAFRLDDIGGTAVTLRTFAAEPVAGNWDSELISTLKTNYLTSTGDSYGLSVTANNELNEVTGIQDTKWMLQPVGTYEAWPYNQMPLRVEVQQGGVTARDPGKADTYLYGSLYVPFDTRMESTVDAAFTLTRTPAEGNVTLQSVSQLNGMGNPQYVPAGWPVILRTNKDTSITLKNQDATTYATRNYINMFLPFDAPQVVDGSSIKLEGSYLERMLTVADLHDAAALNDKTIMVFGLPWTAAAHASHEHDATKSVGFYRNENWAREYYPAYKAHASLYPGTATEAADGQRSNKYVFHNKIYYVYDKAYDGGSPAKPRIEVIFDDGEDEPEEPEIITNDTPWPCDVYDLQGRRVARDETPMTLRKNHPGLPKGVYIFGHKKVLVK